MNCQIDSEEDLQGPVREVEPLGLDQRNRRRLRSERSTSPFRGLPPACSTRGIPGALRRGRCQLAGSSDGIRERRIEPTLGEAGPNPHRCGPHVGALQTPAVTSAIAQFAFTSSNRWLGQWSAVSWGSASGCLGDRRRRGAHGREVPTRLSNRPKPTGVGLPLRACRPGGRGSPDLPAYPRGIAEGRSGCAPLRLERPQNCSGSIPVTGSRPCFVGWRPGGRGKSGCC